MKTVLVVDDFKPWRDFICSLMEEVQGFEVVGRASDGSEAVQKARDLRPDLILLDIGLPTLNGIEAACRIRDVSPASKILFVSENHSVDIAEAALSTGASGYLVKSDAQTELLPAVKAVLGDKRFVSARLADHGLIDPPNPQTGARFHRHNVVTFTKPQDLGITRHHAAEFLF
jgi:DNA-binding NarL/FixJ family response regulator